MIRPTKRVLLKLGSLAGSIDSVPQALLNQIEQALARIDNGTYGYCEDTGEPIELRRLEAQPTATLTTEAQAARERRGR